MHKQDFEDFSALLGDVWGLKGQALTGGQKAMFFRALAAYPLEEVRAGLDAHIKHPDRGRFLPMPADVIAQIIGAAADDGRPGPEEAWAIAYRAKDEAATVVWTEEMSQAFFACQSLSVAGDDIGARMAFKETYIRLVADARAARTPPNWLATLGHDVSARDSALLPHVEAGRIARSELSGPAIGLDTLLALPMSQALTAAGIDARDRAREKLLILRAELIARAAGPSQSDIDRERTQALKAETMGKVGSYEGSAA